MTDWPQGADHGPAASGAAEERAAFGSQARLLISPAVPTSARATVLRDAHAFEPCAAPETRIISELVDLARDAAEPRWLGSVLLGLVLAGAATAAVREPPRLLNQGDGGGPLFPAWVIPVVPAAALLCGVLIALVLVGMNWQQSARTRRTVARWSALVINKDRQQHAAESFPELAQRLAELYALVDRLHGYDGLLADGWLPGLSPARVDELHYTVAERLLATVQLRTARTRAQTRPALAGQVAAADAQLAEADAALDEDLGRLRQLCQAAKDIRGQLHDLRLAEQLEGAASPGSTIRDRLSAPLDSDLPALAAAALDSAALVHAALDPRRLPQQPANS